MNWQYDDPGQWRYGNRTAYRMPDGQFIGDSFDTNARNFGIVDQTGKLIPMTGLDEPDRNKILDRIYFGISGFLIGVGIGILLFGGKK
jgi:hypothetical protein